MLGHDIDRGKRPVSRQVKAGARSSEKGIVLDGPIVGLHIGSCPICLRGF